MSASKAQMPDAKLYCAWQTYTFTGPNGHVREVDLFIATPGGLFLVEIKSHPDTTANNGSTWLFRDGEKIRTVQNPLHFTDQKAKESDLPMKIIPRRPIQSSSGRPSNRIVQVITGEQDHLPSQADVNGDRSAAASWVSWTESCRGTSGR